MKNIVKSMSLALLMLGSTTLSASSGNATVGVGAKSRAMGGVGISKGFGADSGFANPALIHMAKGFGINTTFADITAVEHMEFTLNLTALQQDIGGGTTSSDIGIIPELGFVSIVNDRLAFGIQSTTVMHGYESKAFCYNSNFENTYNTHDILTTDFTIPISVKVGGGLVVGFAPVFHSTKDKNKIVKNGNYINTVTTTSDGVGFTAGLSYKAPMFFLNHFDVTLGAVYKTGIEASGKDIVPSEIGAGVTLRLHANSFVIDYRAIGDDTTVMALGYEYLGSAFAIRTGLNYTDNPEDIFEASYHRNKEVYLTLGAGFDIGGNVSLDFALMHAFENSRSYTNCEGFTRSNTHSQNAFTFGLTTRF